nr:hypothetical protein [Tanacetum cinerariifolium]
MELVLEQTQQGSSYEVSVSAKGVEELKRKVKINGENKEALLTLRQKPVKMEILLEPTSNKLLVAGNPIKEILLKLNLPDHRLVRSIMIVNSLKTEFLIGLVVPVFSLGDDLIACLNKAMAFLTAVATIQDGRVIEQQVQERQGQSYFGTGYKSNATSSRGNNASRQERDKAMLAEAQEAGQVLDEETLAFFADPGF